ncbi:MAG: hypothetical protein PVF22_05015 [Candidatus Aminicenantes bacterium]
MKKFIPPFCLGFAALSFQIILMREFTVHFYGNEISFGLILGSWLLWGGVGSISASRLKFSQKKFVFFYHLAVALFILSLFGLRFSRFLLGTLPAELTGTLPILLYSLALSFFVSFPLGVLFVLNTHYATGNLTKVYTLESLGAAAAGFLVYFLIVPFFSNWQAAALVGTLVILALFLSCRTLRSVPFFLITLFVLALVWAFDFPSQKIYWKPFLLLDSKDTPYGTLQVLKTEEQLSLYNNSLPVYSYPDPAAAEESIHFALLQKPGAEKVLLIGGGAGGGLEQILKYPKAEVDYVELNPDIIQLSLHYLPEEGTRVFYNSRVHVFYDDGVSFLDKTSQTYDIILLNLPDPSTAQINRFYTRDFFLKASQKLVPGGLFSFRVSSAENYISDELRDYLSSLYFTLKDVFPSVEVVPGGTNIFLASSQLVPLDVDVLNERILSLKLDNIYVSPNRLFSRLNPLRVDSLKETISSGRRVLNLDLAPISYFFNSILWSKQFKSFESRLFSSLSRLPFFWLLDCPLILFVLTLVLLGAGRGRKAVYYLAPLVVMGVTTIVVEIIAIICFQTLYGYLYQKISLLFASFMTGLFLGASFGRKGKTTYSQMLLLQSGFILLVSLAWATIQKHPPELLFFIFLFCLGLLGGYLFVVSNRLYLKERQNYGLGYGLDLLGSFAGALGVSAFLIPLVGLPLLLKYVVLLNSFCLLFLLWGFFRGLR